MADEDPVYDAVERLEWDERHAHEHPYKRLRQVTRRTALTGGAAGLVALALEACGGSHPSNASASRGGGSASGIFGTNQKFKFTFVNHVTTNSFFIPTQAGAADACRLLGCSYHWTGSETSNVSEMVNAINTAVRARSNGIATTLIDPTAFSSPVSDALAAGVPVVAYNSDVAGNPRLAYVGQNLFQSGQAMGDRIASLVPSGDVALFIATPGQLNLEPRLDGALDALKKYPSLVPHVAASGAAEAQELTFIKSYMNTFPDYRGFFAVDGGSTAATAQSLQETGLAKKGAKGGGFDLTPITEQLLAAGYIQFAIDQQPYLQGFMPILELYLYNATQKLAGIADVNTGQSFVDESTVRPFVATKTRYEGTGTAVGVQHVKR